MTTPEHGGRRTAGVLQSRWLRIAVTALIVIGVIVLALGVWYIFFRPAGPPPIGTDAPVIPEGASSTGALLATVSVALA